MCATIISCCYASPIFEPAEHIFDFMPLFIQGFAISGWEVSTLPGWNTGCYFFGFQGGAKFIAVIALVADQTRSTVRQSGIDQFCTNMIAQLPLTQAHDYRAALSIANRMQFGVQSTLCAPDTAGNIPFFSRLHAVRWALR